MGRPVVFVIDMLNDCFGHAELDRMRAALCSSINRLTALARAKGFPVVWVRQEFEADLSDAFLDMKRENIRMFIKGTRGPLILDELIRDDSDIEVVKKRYSMFYGTGLESLLEDLEADSLVIAGVNSHACIRAAAIDAYQRDLPVTIVRECVASKDPMHHEMTMAYLGGGIATLVTLDAFQAGLGSSTPPMARTALDDSTRITRKEAAMNAPSRSQLVAALDQAVSYLNTVRETHWSRRLSDVRSAVEADPRKGASQVLAVLPELGSLYLTIKSGHNVSERQEIPSNAKLSAMREQLRVLAEGQLRSDG